MALLRATSYLVFGLLVACGDDGGEGSPSDFAAVELGKLSSSPEVLVFDSTEIGETTVQYITLVNLGGGDLVVDRIETDDVNEAFNFVGVVLPLRLAPDDEQIVEVHYTPDDCAPDSGDLVIYSNDPDHSDGYTLPVHTQELTGEVRVVPDPIEYGRVPTGAEETVGVTITNVGTCVLTVNDLFLSGTSEFAFTRPGDGGAQTLQPELPVRLEAARSHSFDITYRPENDGYDQGTLIVRSDDSSHRTIDVSIVANSDTPCIEVTDETGIDFGIRFIGEIHAKQIGVTNCSRGQNLKLSRIELLAHDWLPGGDRFTMSELPDLSETVVVTPLDSISFSIEYEHVLYTPESDPDLCSEEPCDVVDGAMLQFRSNDQAKDPLEVEIRGLGSDNHCPVAVARARVLGGGGPWDTEVDVAPLQTIIFDASESYDPDGEITDIQWEVLERPLGSASQLLPNAEVDNPTFFLDVGETFIFRLRVYDDRGAESCESSDVIVVVTPEEDIYVQCVWLTPGDEDPEDLSGTGGSDVDCHLLHPNGLWDQEPWDCYWRNPTPNWGDTGTADDDPSLDLDDTDGWGPENISLDNPEGTDVSPATYSVGAYHFNAHSYGPSDVTVRIFLSGIPRFVATYEALDRYQFWDVARIAWPTGDIVRVDRLYPDGFP